MRKFSRKCLSLLMVMTMLLTMLLMGVQAAGTPEISISSGTAKPGESVLLKISIKDNPGIAAAKIYIYYDTDTFDVDPDEDLSPCGAFSTSGSILGNTVEKSGGDAEGVLVLWYNKMGQNTDADGAFLTVSLQTKETAANGDYSIRLGYSPENVCNEESRKVALHTVGGVITVTGASYEKEPEEENVKEEQLKEIPTFIDVSGNWAEDYIYQAAERRLIEGYMGEYRPNDTMTRAEFVTILWRAMGRPEPTKATSFKDLTQDWYKDAVAWAEENTVVNGMSEGVFAPNGTVTREQMVTIFHRMAGTPIGMEAMLTSIYDSQYPDSGAVGSWAKSALYWSIYNGIYCGTNSEEIGSRLEPRLPATRAQIAVMIVRYLDMSE